MASARLAYFWLSPVFCIFPRRVLAQANPNNNSNNLINQVSRVKLTWRMNQLRMMRLTRQLALRESAIWMGRFPCRLAEQATGVQRGATVR